MGVMMKFRFRSENTALLILVVMAVVIMASLIVASHDPGMIMVTP